MCGVHLKQRKTTWVAKLLLDGACKVTRSWVAIIFPQVLSSYYGNLLKKEVFSSIGIKQRTLDNAREGVINESFNLD